MEGASFIFLTIGGTICGTRIRIFVEHAKSGNYFSIFYLEYDHGELIKPPKITFRCLGGQRPHGEEEDTFWM